MSVSPAHIIEDIGSIKKREISLIDKADVYSALEPITNNLSCQKCHGQNKVVAFLDVDTKLTQAEINFYTGSLHFIFLGIVIIIILFIGFYYLFNHFINNPLKKLISGLELVGHGNFTTRLPVEREDEFGILNKNFNVMASELESSRTKIEELHLDQLQRADRLITVGELTAQIAHEINNHTAVIMARADYLQLKSADSAGNQSLNEDLNVIIGQTEKISDITNNILRHSKKLSKEFEKLNLIKVVENSLQILGPLISKENVNISKNYEIESPYIKGNAVQLEQVITNLVTNALDALSGNGSLKISVRNISTSQIEFRISDNGMGIAQKDLDQIFSPFFTTNAARGGTGLGLYIVNNICRNHDASIRVESEQGKGTTFIIVFKRIEDK